jgi:hypothetical protein
MLVQKDGSTTVVLQTGPKTGIVIWSEHPKGIGVIHNKMDKKEYKPFHGTLNYHQSAGRVKSLPCIIRDPSLDATVLLMENNYNSDETVRGLVLRSGFHLVVGTIQQYPRAFATGGTVLVDLTISNKAFFKRFSTPCISEQTRGLPIP